MITAEPRAQRWTARPWVIHEAKQTLRLAIPIVGTEFLLLALSIVDIGFLGRSSSLEFAGASLARALHFAALSFGIGMVAALEPVIAGASARGDERATWRGISAALVLLAPAACGITLLSLVILEVSRAFGVGDDIATPARAYLLASAPTTFLYLAFLAVKVVLQARGRAGLVFVAVAAVNVLNWAACAALTAPHPGSSAELRLTAGTVAVVHGSMFLVLFAIGLAASGGHRHLFRESVASIRTEIAHLARTGALVGLQMMAEAGAATIIGAWVATRGTRDNNAFQAVSGLYALAFMLSFGFGDAASLRVGSALGRRESPRRAALVTLALNTVVALGASATFALFGPELVARFTNDPEVLRLGTTLIRLAALTHLFSATQVVLFGVLRGASDMRFIFMCALVSHGAVALPVSLALGTWLELGAVGAWIGIALGHATASVALFVRVLSKTGAARARAA